MTSHESNEFENLKEKIKTDLINQYGPMISGKNLVKALGYSSGDAFRQAVRRKTIPVRIFQIDNRRGKYALAIDIATWIAKQRLKNGGD